MPFFLLVLTLCLKKRYRNILDALTGQRRARRWGIWSFPSGRSQGMCRDWTSSATPMTPCPCRIWMGNLCLISTGSFWTMRRSGPGGLTTSGCAETPKPSVYSLCLSVSSFTPFCVSFPKMRESSRVYREGARLSKEESGEVAQRGLSGPPLGKDSLAPLSSRNFPLSLSVYPPPSLKLLPHESDFHVYRLQYHSSWSNWQADCMCKGLCSCKPRISLCSVFPF